MHELGLAFDLWVNDESQLADLGQVWESMGGVWGGHFRDPIHFEAGGDLSDYAPDAAQAASDPQPSWTEKAADLVTPLVAPGVGVLEVAGQLISPSRNSWVEDLRKSLSSPSYAVEATVSDISRFVQWVGKFF